MNLKKVSFWAGIVLVLGINLMMVAETAPRSVDLGFGLSAETLWVIRNVVVNVVGITLIVLGLRKNGTS